LDGKVDLGDRSVEQGLGMSFVPGEQETLGLLPVGGLKADTLAGLPVVGVKNGVSPNEAVTVFHLGFPQSAKQPLLAPRECGL
jgi:hypothetical protein